MQLYTGYLCPVTVGVEANRNAQLSTRGIRSPLHRPIEQLYITTTQMQTPIGYTESGTGHM